MPKPIQEIKEFLLSEVAKEPFFPKDTLSIIPISTPGIIDIYKIKTDSKVLILRIEENKKNTFHSEKNILQREAVTIKLILKYSTLPVPKIFSQKIHPQGFTYSLMECMPGNTLDKNLNLNSKNLDHTLIQIGQSLQKLHSIKGTRFGTPILQAPYGKHSSWKSAFKYLWTASLQDLQKNKLINLDQLHTFEQCLSTHTHILDEIKTPALIHTDIWHGNILTLPSGKLSGIIDWGGALWADPAMEFTALDNHHINRTSLRIGYQNPIFNSPTFKARTQLYTLYKIFHLIFHQNIRENKPESAERHLKICFDLAKEMHAV